jgi:hypothetical protein
MAGRSDCQLLERFDKEPEIFDRLFKLDTEDISWIKRHIRQHLEACKGYMDADPPQWKDALREAQEATTIAIAERMKNTESMINFYTAQCYRGLCMWKEAYKFYTESTVDAPYAHWLKMLRITCRKNLERQRDPELRRVKGSDNLRMAYSEDEVEERVPFRRGW